MTASWRRAIDNFERFFPLVRPLRKPAADLWYSSVALLYRLLHQLHAIGGEIWGGASRYRPLLYKAPDQLSIWQRAKRQLLLFFLAVPDPFFRRTFIRLDQGLRSLTTDAVATADDRSGIAMMIGALHAGGAERQFVLTLRGLKARGHGPVSAGCVYLDTPAQRFFLPHLHASGISVRVIGSDPVDTREVAIEELIRALPRSLQTVLDYASSLKAWRPQIAHLWLDEVNIKGGIAAALTGVPRIVLSQRNIPPHNFSFHAPYMREAYRWLARQPGVVMVNNSRCGAAEYERWLGLPAGTIKVVHNGFDFSDEMLRGYRLGRNSYRAELGIPIGAPLVGGVLRFSEEKRPLLWLEAAAAVRRRIAEARFLLIGDGPLSANVADRAQRPDLIGAIHLPGPEKDPLRAMADMDLLLLTSRAEGLPNVLVEAQVVGTPVVTPPVGGAPETVRHGITGWILAQDDPELIAEKIVELLHDRAWRKKARQEAPEFVKITFGIDRVIDDFVAVYRDEPTIKTKNN